MLLLHLERLRGKPEVIKGGQEEKMSGGASANGDAQPAYARRRRGFYP